MARKAAEGDEKDGVTAAAARHAAARSDGPHLIATARERNAGDKDREMLAYGEKGNVSVLAC